MRRSGDCWEAICSRCDHASECRWQSERPTGTPVRCGWCLAEGADASWQHIWVRPVSLGRVSGFSTSESDFTPHWNKSFGQPVHSLAEMKALQENRDASDVVVKGDAAERHIPRDIGTRLKHHREVAENPERKLGRFTEPDA